MVGGSRFARKFAGPHSGVKGTVLRQRCDARGFKPLPIEIIAQRKVVPAFEPQRVSGRMAPPPPPDAARWGGRGSPRKICRSPIFLSSVRQLLRQRCDARRFETLPIEIPAKQKVASAFEPQKVSGRMDPASECNAMDASGPTALSCCACFQHEACGDHSLSNVV